MNYKFIKSSVIHINALIENAANYVRGKSNCLFLSAQRIMLWFVPSLSCRNYPARTASYLQQWGAARYPPCLHGDHVDVSCQFFFEVGWSKIWTWFHNLRCCRVMSTQMATSSTVFSRRMVFDPQSSMCTRYVVTSSTVEDPCIHIFYFTTFANQRVARSQKRIYNMLPKANSSSLAAVFAVAVAGRHNAHRYCQQCYPGRQLRQHRPVN